MIENLEIEINAPMFDSGSWTLNIFGRQFEFFTHYEEIEEYIVNFCEEWNIDYDTLVVIEN